MTQEPLPARADAESLLAWYEAMGVDVALGESPVDRLAPPRPVPAPPPRLNDPPAEPRPVPAAGTVPSNETALAARDVAKAAATLDELREALARFEGCNLRLTATQLVFADGNPDSRVMLVGEAPGRDEDIQGLPFVGRSGQLLDRMLAAIGLDRTTVYIANAVPWRPPGNRKPTPQETAICRPFIDRQIELADPDLLIFLGDVAAREFLRTTEGITKVRGRWRDYPTGRRIVRAMATFHPAYLLRTPVSKRLAWRDFLAVKAALDGNGAAAAPGEP